MRSSVLVSFTLSVLLSGCSWHIADMSVASTRYPVQDMHALVKGQRVTGETYAPYALVPLGMPNIKDALDQAIQSDHCAVGLSDVIVREQYYALLVGVIGYEVEGNLLIDSSKPGCI